MTDHPAFPGDQASASSSNLPDLARALDQQLTHVWMVRAFLKHADESVEDEELAEVVRDLQDFITSVGPLDDDDEPVDYLAKAKKKLRKLVAATEMYESIQPDISAHANFVMAARSLRLAVNAIKATVEIR